MGTKLNPEGAKIKALRIQRGWTQEQLAEIAGISLRTVQRAEAANSAAFETIKAIAAAFETDFDRLLKPEHTGNTDQKLLVTVGEDPEPEKIASKRTASKVWRIWPIPIIAVSTLTLGLVIGISFTSHQNRHSQSLPVASLSSAKMIHADPAPAIKSWTATISPQALPRKTTVPRSITKTAASNPEMDYADKVLSFPVEAPPAARLVLTTDATSLELVQSSGPELLPLEMVSMPISITEAPISQTLLSDNPGFSRQDAQETGAVRQAVSLAAKKTGGFVSRARDSIKRAF